MFRIGEKVQAVDELGRWENARVIALDEDGLATVHFTGWDSSFDVKPDHHQIRRPIDFSSYSEAERSEGKLNSFHSILFNTINSIT